MESVLHLRMVISITEGAGALDRNLCTTRNACFFAMNPTIRGKKATIFSLITGNQVKMNQKRFLLTAPSLQTVPLLSWQKFD